MAYAKPILPPISKEDAMSARRLNKAYSLLYLPIKNGKYKELRPILPARAHKAVSEAILGKLALLQKRCPHEKAVKAAVKFNDSINKKTGHDGGVTFVQCDVCAAYVSSEKAKTSKPKPKK
jgi:hypothetical protein